MLPVERPPESDAGCQQSPPRLGCCYHQVRCPPRYHNRLSRSSGLCRWLSQPIPIPWRQMRRLSAATLPQTPWGADPETPCALQSRLQGPSSLIDLPLSADETLLGRLSAQSPTSKSSCRQDSRSPDLPCRRHGNTPTLRTGTPNLRPRTQANT